jgi:hypothetical protein
MERVELLQSPDPDKLALFPDAEERHVHGAEPSEIERMYVLRRAVLSGEGQVRLEERSDVGGPGIVGSDDQLTHGRILAEETGWTSLRMVLALDELVVSGPPSDLLLALWRRLPLTVAIVEGDGAAAARFVERTDLEWRPCRTDPTGRGPLGSRDALPLRRRRFSD